jgi:hypothetical protein
MPGCSTHPHSASRLTHSRRSSTHPPTRRQGSDTSDQAVKLAVLKALKSRIRDLEIDINAHLMSILDEGDAKAASLPDGARLGKFTKTRGRATPTITDERKFLQWVQDRHPDEIEQTIRPAFRTKILDSAKKYGEAVDPTTGEVVPGIELRHGDPYISFRSEPGYQQLVAERWHEIVGPRLLDGDL